MTTLDRYLLKSLIANYLIALSVMMSLYVVLDLFVNIDEFTESSSSTMMLLSEIAHYYGAHSFLYFSQLSGVITLFACAVTIARMRRANELTAVLASGVSLFRVAVPAICFGIAASLLWYVDTEVIVPRLAHLLARSHEDAKGIRSRGVWFVNDGPCDLVSALEFIPAEKKMEKLLVLHRDEHGRITQVTTADAATWRDIPGHPKGGVWGLENGERIRRETNDSPLAPRAERVADPVDQYESLLAPDDFEARQSEQWLEYTSSSDLKELADREPVLTQRIRRTRHGRFATPLVHLLLLMLGLPFFLSREPAKLVSDAGKCLAVCGSCYMLAYAGENFVRSDTLSALPAWLPIIVFTPVAVFLTDRIRT